MKHLLLLGSALLVVFFFRITLADPVPSDLLEYRLGLRRTWFSSGHPHAHGVNLRLEYPASWHVEASQDEDEIAVLGGSPGETLTIRIDPSGSPDDTPQNGFIEREETVDDTHVYTLEYALLHNGRTITLYFNLVHSDLQVLERMIRQTRPLFLQMAQDVTFAPSELPDTLQRLRKELTTFSDGRRRTFTLPNLPNAPGVQLSFDYPASWQPTTTDSEVIVIASPYLEIIALLLPGQPLPDLPAAETLQQLVDQARENPNFLSGALTTRNGRLWAIYETTSPIDNHSSHTLHYATVQDRQLIVFSFFVPKTEALRERLSLAKPLFENILETVTFRPTQ